MESFTDLPETLASMTLMNNMNSDILANDGQIKSQLIHKNVNLSNGLKSFHHGRSNFIDNQIHHTLNTTAQHEHHQVKDTNKITQTEDKNNNLDNNIDEIITSSYESDSSLSSYQSFISSEETDSEMIENIGNLEGRAKRVRKLISKMEKLHNSELNYNTGKTQAIKINEPEIDQKRAKVIRNNPRKKMTTKLQRNSKELVSLPISEDTPESLKIKINNTCEGEEEKDYDLGRKVQDELLMFLAKKNNKDTCNIEENGSQLIQRRKEEELRDICQVCDKPPPPSSLPPNDRLLSYTEMPPHLQFNPYITSGYRPILNAWGCLRSLCYVHNETVNIFTHGLPIIYILLTVPKTMPWYLQDTRSQFLIWSHLAGATCPWLGSILYHLFMNCGSSPLLYKRLLQIDMFGIWISQSFGALPMLFASVHCLSSNVRFIVIASYCLFSIWGLHKALIATTPWSRRICFALPFMMRNLLCLLRLTKYGGGAPDSLVPTILQDVMCIIGGVIGAEKVPEKWWPGSTDFCFNSHNLMHVLALLALYYNNKSSVRDIQWMKTVKTLP